MAGTPEAACARLRTSNPPKRFLLAAGAVIAYASNLVNHPEEDKYKHINLSNTNFQAKVFQVPGGEELMYALGYVRDGAALVFRTTDTSAAQKIIAILQPQVKAVEAEQEAASAAAAAAAASRPSHEETTQRAHMMSRLTSQLGNMRVYEDPQLQSEARRIIPVKTLGTRARERPDADTKSFSDRLLLELLAWFKKEFFTWVDTVPCAACGGKTRNTGSLPPTEDDRKWGAERVERHDCETCGHVNRFPRYNHPGKLLQTRRGRCGEWANCFVLCCRALAFETRYVLDFTDHVWAEVYSKQQEKWLHCDPCENACDTPLLYEAGWGKKLNYVFAFAIHGVADVIWRYSAQRDATLSRRTLVPEPWLASVIDMINAQEMPETESRDLKRRYEEEKRQLTEPPPPASQGDANGDQTLPGRQTGSEEWRRARGEMGGGPSGGGGASCGSTSDGASGGGE